MEVSTEGGWDAREQPDLRGLFSRQFLTATIARSHSRRSVASRALAADNAKQIRYGQAVPRAFLKARTSSIGTPCGEDTGEAGLVPESRRKFCRSRYNDHITMRWARRWIPGIVITLVGVALFRDTPVWLGNLELWTYDARMRFVSGQPDSRIVIVTADARTVGKLGPYPLARHFYTDLVSRLSGAGAKVIGMDIGFAKPDPDDEGFAAAVSMVAPALTVLMSCLWTVQGALVSRVKS